MIVTRAGALAPTGETLPVVVGEQRWCLLRAGIVDAEQVATEAGDLVLSLAQALGGDLGGPAPAWSTGPGEYRFYEFRPAVFGAPQHGAPALPRGRILGSRATYPGRGLPYVAQGKEAAWYVPVSIWYRGKSPATVPWPSTYHGIAWDASSPLTWTLEWAVEPAVKSDDPGGATWTDVKGEAVKESVSSVVGGLGSALATTAKIIAGTAGALAIVWMVSKLRK